MAQRARPSWTRALVPTLALVALAFPLSPAAASGGAAPATVTAAASDPSAPVLLMPGLDWVNNVVVADDAIYAIGPCLEAGCPLVRRSMEVTDDTITLGAPTLVSRTSGRFIEHEGTTAHWRTYDERMVLRAPDGSEDLPSWGTDHRLQYGPNEGLSERWLLSGSMLVDRTTGTVTMPFDPYFEGAETVERSAALQGDVLAWWDFYRSPYGSGTMVLARTLGAEAAAYEPPTLLAHEPTSVSSDLSFVGIADGSIVWQRFGAYGDPADANTLRWYPWPGGEMSELELLEDQYAVAVTGDEVVLQQSLADAGTSVLTWVDVSGTTGATTRTADLGSVHVEDVAGSLVAFTGETQLEPEPWLVDADGREIVADQTPLELPGWFSDIARDSSFTGDISWLVDNGITQGYSDGTYRPRAVVSREQMAAFLYRMAGEPEVEVPAEAEFSDVGADHPFVEPITWLAGTGITKGHADGTFRPGGAVSRGQMAAFLARFAGEEPPEPASAPFSDVPTGHTFAAEIDWLAGTSITTGFTDGTFRPGQAVSRQHMAAFLHRFHRADLTT